MNVAENLFDYLKHNDLAEIPGLGTFVVKSSSARINDITNTIIPPSRKVVFEKKEGGDMSFVNYFAQNEYINTDTALTWIKQYSDSVKDKIAQGRHIEIGRLGKLSKGLLDDYAFETEADLNLLDDAFALGELKNVKTYKSEEIKVEVIHTKDSIIEETPSIPEEVIQKQEELEKKIEEAKQLKEEEKSQETKEETQTRIIQHTEAIVETLAATPIAAEEVTDKLDVDATPIADRTQETIEKAEENKENIIVEDIKPAEKEMEVADKDAMQMELQDIVKKHSSTPKGKTKKTKKKKRGFWFVLFWIVLILLLLCGGFVGAHWMGFLKDIKALSPITDKLSYYIPVRNAESETTVIQSAVQTPTEEPEISVEEVSATEETAPEIATEAPAPQYYDNSNQTQKAATPKKKATTTNTNKTKQTTATQPQQQATIVEDNTPVLSQNYSKLGFDVVDGTYSDKKRAEQQARKAKSLGYDSYVLSKIKSGTPIYYVSYGSRRTLAEANDLMSNMKTKMGGNYYVISR